MEDGPTSRIGVRTARVYTGIPGLCDSPSSGFFRAWFHAWAAGPTQKPKRWSHPLRRDQLAAFSRSGSWAGSRACAGDVAEAVREEALGCCSDCCNSPSRGSGGFQSLRPPSRGGAAGNLG